MKTKQIRITTEDFIHPVGFQWAYLNQKPHLKQIEVLCSSQKNKVIVCGRRAGKSQMIGGELIRGGVLPQTITDKKSSKQIVIAPTYKQTMIVYNKITDLMQRAGTYEDIAKEIKSPHPQIVFKNGSIIDFGSADNPTSLRGEAYDRVFLDEGEFIKEEAMSAIRPLIYDTGAPMWITTTPWKRNFVWEFWKRGLSGDEDWGSFNYCYLDNPYITDEGKREIQKDIDEWGMDSLFVQAEIFGKYVNNTDCYFDMEDVNFCVAKGCDHGQPHPKKRYVAGVDCAGEGEDRSVCVVLEIDVMKQEHRIIEIRKLDKNKPRELVVMLQEVDEKYNLERLYIDKTGLGEGPSDWIGMEIGYNKVEDIRFSTVSKMDMYSNLRVWIQKRKLKEIGGEMKEVPCLMLPDDKNLLREMMELRYEKMPNKTVKIHHPDGGKYHDDYCFIAGTKVMTNKGQMSIEKLKVGDMVMTRKGYKKIIGTGNRKSKVITRFGITGTANHPFITNHGIEKFINVKVSDNVYIWNQKQSRIMEKNIIDIQTPKEDIYEYIIGDIQLGKNPLNHCIELFGKTNMEKYLEDMLSTTEMKIPLTIKLKILKLCQEENISLSIAKVKKEKDWLKKTWNYMQDLKLLNGINLRLGKKFIKELEKYLGRIEKNTPNVVKNVIRNIKHIFQQEVDFVPINVNKETGIKEEIVYNISVEGCNEYFVNNILVHNCDALALACLWLKDEDKEEYESFIM